MGQTAERLSTDPAGYFSLYNAGLYQDIKAIWVANGERIPGNIVSKFHPKDQAKVQAILARYFRYSN